MSNRPIADYALISDCHSAALVSVEGSVEWLCFPRFDSPSIFAGVLDEAAGHFSITPAGTFEASRRYLDRSMLLETTFVTPAGVAVLVDGMAVGPDERGHKIGKQSPGILLRRVSCLEGEVELEVSYAPRPEYGLIEPWLRPVEGGLAARGGADLLMLSAPVEFEVSGSTARARLGLRKGEHQGFALAHAQSWEERPMRLREAEIDARLDDALAAWQAWSDLHQTYRGPWENLVQHSARVLQALTFAPTGAIVAAPTTSLPETVGGARNWDYRFAWVRDASLTLNALWVAACPDEARDFFVWMASSAASQVHSGARLQIMFGVGGEHDLTERELGHLCGWRSSRPVRVGNAAWEQHQLDIFGELLDAADRLSDHLMMLDPTTREFLVVVADAAAARWTEPDQGIWEMRGPPQHFLYSKLMCWVALDRAIRLAGLLDATDHVDEWARTRDEVRAAILRRGWSDRAQAFAQALGSDELDASALVLPIAGFLPADDPRMLSTLDRIERDLTDTHGLVYRYRAHDGLEGEEGTFLLCTFWLAHAQALAGRVDGARATFERAVAYANDVGLLAEQVDPTTGQLLGNFPQAFSHIGLIDAAWAIREAERAWSPSGVSL